MSPSTSDPKKIAGKPAAQFDPDAVVFSGDGEPQTPESLLAKLQDLHASGHLNPDSYALGGSVEALEARCAKVLGKPAAIWFPTGTLANHMAIRRHCGMNPRAFIQEQSHIYHDEGDGLARLSGINAVPLAKGRPYFTAAELETALQEAGAGRVVTPPGVVVVESPVRRQAGQIAPWNEMTDISDLCRSRGVPSHLDGARLFMMSAATGIGIREYAALFDSVYISMYKYFGAPFGAILAGTQDFIEDMYHDRRMFGGGLSSAYLPTALALRGMDGFEQRFGEAMSKAGKLFDPLNQLPGITVRRFEHGSNIVELDLGEDLDVILFIASLLETGIVIAPPSVDWPVALLHVNTTILRKSNQEIVKAFTAAATSAQTS